MKLTPHTKAKMTPELAAQMEKLEASASIDAPLGLTLRLAEYDQPQTKERLRELGLDVVDVSGCPDLACVIAPVPVGAFNQALLDRQVTGAKIGDEPMEWLPNITRADINVTDRSERKAGR